MNEAVVKKLRLSSDAKALVLQSPDHSYLEELGLAGDAAQFAEAGAGTYDFVLLFAPDIAGLEAHARKAIQAVKRDGLLWICYPKGTAKLKTDLNRDRGWNIVTEAGWEGIALVSIDDTWSAMRFRPAGLVNSTTRANRTPDPGKAAGSRAAASQEELIVPNDLRAALGRVFKPLRQPDHGRSQL